MPIVPTPLGIFYYAYVQVLGYSVAGCFLKRKFEHSLHFFVFGIARTILGIIVGFSYVANTEEYGLVCLSPIFFVLLLPVRFAEWFFLIWLFYHRHGITIRQLILYSSLGTIWSYVLDVPAIASVIILPGGSGFP